MNGDMLYETRGDLWPGKSYTPVSIKVQKGMQKVKAGFEPWELVIQSQETWPLSLVDASPLFYTYLCFRTFYELDFLQCMYDSNLGLQ